MVNVKTSNGEINGIHKDGIDTFLGIPYATLSNGRFNHSKVYKQWSEAIHATHVQSIPPQPYNQLEDFFSSDDDYHFNQFSQHEDCLYLNIWRQHHHSESRPVIIYFYGGGFINGHANVELYSPKNVVKQEDVIVVTFNYRLGAWGFLDWSYINSNYDLNNGLSDQLNVLKWVHQNIEDFGGDPNNVTLMGQSAGSMSIMALMQLPHTYPYFHKIMLLSGILNLDSPTIGYDKAQRFSNLISKQCPNVSIDALSTDDILNIMMLDQTSRGNSKGLELIYAPIQTADMDFNNANFSKPIFVSYTKNEGDIYIKNESRKLTPERFVEAMSFNKVNIDSTEAISAKQQSDFITKYIFQQPVHRFLNDMKHNPNIWLACFQWHRTDSKYYKSAYHILDMIFWFGNLNILKAHQLSVTQHETKLSSKMIHDLCYFATHSKMPWTPYNEDNKRPFQYK